MSRFVVSAVSAEQVASDTLGGILIYVAVSRADNGKSVTGLTKDNFRIAEHGSNVVISSCGESKWGPAGTESSGCYQLSIKQPDLPSVWVKGEYYQLGVQARTFKGKKVVGCGQAVVNVQSLGT